MKISASVAGRKDPTLVVAQMKKKHNLRHIFVVLIKSEGGIKCSRTFNSEKSRSYQELPTSQFCLNLEDQSFLISSFSSADEQTFNFKTWE